MLDPDGAAELEGGIYMADWHQLQLSKPLLAGLVDNGHSPSPGVSLVFFPSRCCGGGAKAKAKAKAIQQPAQCPRAHQQRPRPGGSKEPRGTRSPFWSRLSRPADEPMTGRRGPDFWPAWARQFGQRRRDLVGLPAEGGEGWQHEARLKGRLGDGESLREG